MNQKNLGQRFFLYAFSFCAHDTKKERNMKRFFRLACAFCAVLILIWYSLPSVYQILHAPKVVDFGILPSAPALRITSASTQFVRSGIDERLSDRQTTERTLRLFGLLPLRTFQQQIGGRTVAVGGEAVGVVLKTNGVQIVGLGEIETEEGRRSPAADAGLRQGDVILAVNNHSVADTASFTSLCRSSAGDLSLSFQRDGSTFTVTVRPERDKDGVARIGAWVRDSTSGIGTMSFYDPHTRFYAALGHGVTDVDTGKLIAPSSGYLTEAVISSVRVGTQDRAGELIGTFSVREADAIATISQNTEFGISGKLGSSFRIEQSLRSVAPPDAAHLGDASIITTTSGQTPHTYRVRVIRVDVQSSPNTQGMMIEIIDPALLGQTGGIVQGMSGSPLIQDGKLIGVVTHVFLSHPTRGYCLYAAWMAEKLLPFA